MLSNASRCRADAGGQELEHGHLLRRVAEVVADRRLQHVVDEVLHRADARDHARRVLHADVDDLRDVEAEREAVLRAHEDRRQPLVVVVRLGALRPVQDDVRRRHELDLHHARVDRVLAGQQRLDPHALAAALDEVAVRERVAGHVEVLAADVADDHADVADRDLGQRHQLDPHEPRVEVPRAGEQHLLLQAAAAAGVDEGLAALEAVVPGDERAREVTRRDRAAVERGDDADAVGGHLIAPADRRASCRALARVSRRHDVEQRRVDPVGAGGQERELAAALAAVAQERLGVLEVVARRPRARARAPAGSPRRPPRRPARSRRARRRRAAPARPCTASARARSASRAAASAPGSRPRRSSAMSRPDAQRRPKRFTTRPDSSSRMTHMPHERARPAPATRRSTTSSPATRNEHPASAFRRPSAVEPRPRRAASASPARCGLAKSGLMSRAVGNP